MAALSSDDRQQLIEQLLESDLLLRPERSADLWSDVTGTVLVDGQGVRIGVALGSPFPLRLPTVFAYPWDSLGFLPHVVPTLDETSTVGIVCYRDPEGTVLDRKNPFGLVAEAVELAVEVLHDGVSGRNRKDFAEEWENHWSRTASAPSWWIVGDVPDRPTTMALYPVGDGSTCILARSLGNVTAFRRGAPKASGRKVLFVPLAEGTEPTPPPPRGPAWTASDLRAFIRANARPRELAQVQKKAQRLRRRFSGRAVEAVVFSLPRPSGGQTLFGVEFSGVGRKHPLLQGQCDVRHVAVNRWDRAYLVPRGGADNSLDSKRVLIVGCGAVGSRIAVELVRAGVLHLTLVDPDRLHMENVFRHVLGRSSVGKNKAVALKAHLDTEIPYVDVAAVGESIHTAMASGAVDVSDFDLVICALGDPTIEMDLNEQLWSSLATPVVYSWVEPYGIGGHALLTRPGEQGCFECLYTLPGERSTAGLANRAAFAGPPPAGRTYGKALSGCGSLFTPYGSADAAQSALLAVRLGVGMLTGSVKGSPLLSWKGDATAFEREGFSVTGRHRKGADQLDAERYGYVSQGCSICGTTA